MSPGAQRRLTLALAVLTVLVLVVSIPGALRDAWDRGGLYLFSREFLEDIPRRLTGPGRLRFVVQPLVATAAGIVAGRADRRHGRAPYLKALVLGDGPRGALVRSGSRDIANLVLLGVLVDAVCQWLLFGVSHPGAALIVGPVLITAPYAVARALANRMSTPKPAA